jgi:acylphosphatase
LLYLSKALEKDNAVLHSTVRKSRKQARNETNKGQIPECNSWLKQREKGRMRTAHVVISGKVQGVFFRSTLKSKADELNVKGWARNLEDGTVEALLEGGEEEVGKIIEWCHVGPSGARVDAVRVTVHTTANDKSNYRNFAIVG